jgi:hypothetical protein
MTYNTKYKYNLLLISDKNDTVKFTEKHEKIKTYNLFLRFNYKLTCKYQLNNS